MMFGFTLFDADTSHAIDRQILEFDPSAAWAIPDRSRAGDLISPHAVGFLRACLQPDAAARPSADALLALCNAWIVASAPRGSVDEHGEAVAAAAPPAEAPAPEQHQQPAAAASAPPPRAGGALMQHASSARAAATGAGVVPHFFSGSVSVPPEHRGAPFAAMRAPQQEGSAQHQAEAPVAAGGRRLPSLAATLAAEMAPAGPGSSGDLRLVPDSLSRSHAGGSAASLGDASVPRSPPPAREEEGKLGSARGRAVAMAPGDSLLQAAAAAPGTPPLSPSADGARAMMAAAAASSSASSSSAAAGSKERMVPALPRGARLRPARKSAAQLLCGEGAAGEARLSCAGAQGVRRNSTNTVMPLPPGAGPPQGAPSLDLSLAAGGDKRRASIFSRFFASAGGPPPVEVAGPVTPSPSASGRRSAAAAAAGNRNLSWARLAPPRQAAPSPYGSSCGSLAGGAPSAAPTCASTGSFNSTLSGMRYAGLRLRELDRISAGLADGGGSGDDAGHVEALAQAALAAAEAAAASPGLTGELLASVSLSREAKVLRRLRQEEEREKAARRRKGGLIKRLGRFLASAVAGGGGGAGGEDSRRSSTASAAAPRHSEGSRC